ncbi:MAG: tryptophan-rich sensory protein [Clostridiales bacterium]|jgi:benzodiazapine receptor|nr:tryptophan-rich sensory protein [Clostridiales bacterium]
MSRFKPLLMFFIFPMLIGLWAANITVNAMQSFRFVTKPDFTPNIAVIPIIIFLVYILMGISAYLVHKSKSYGRETPLYIWVLQLVFCFFWSITFFSGAAYQLSFIWISVLWVLILVMTLRFFAFKPLAGYLQIPYLICATFAVYLNFMVYFLNK